MHHYSLFSTFLTACVIFAIIVSTQRMDYILLMVEATPLLVYWPSYYFDRLVALIYYVVCTRYTGWASGPWNRKTDRVWP